MDLSISPEVVLKAVIISGAITCSMDELTLLDEIPLYPWLFFTIFTIMLYYI